MLQVIFGVVILVSGVVGWFFLPFWSAAVIRMPSDVRAERVAPQVVRVLTSERFLGALSSECESDVRRARVRRMGTTDVQIAFRCDTADGAARGVKAILMRAFELDVTENGMVVDRPMAPVEVDTTPLNDPLRRADATSSRGGGPSPGRPLNFEIVQKPTEPARRLFY